MFGSNKVTLKEAVEKAEALAAENAQLKERISALEADAGNAEAIKTELAEANAKLETAQNEANAAQAKVAKLEADLKTAEAKGAAAIASQYGDPAPVAEPKGDVDPNATKAELWAHYQTLTDARERRAFYLDRIKGK